MMVHPFRINWDKLKLFYQVASYPSFKDAGEALGKNQSNISRVIQQLERQLQCPLFIRSPAGLELTKSGIILLKTAKPIMDSLQSALTHIQQVK
jgi:DNA-binding transcriptional LysR family regulator